ncbi:MAG: nodB [Planctomycetota bacterium]|nr:MAG: nodB [Planctomycetota bacterium]
MSTVNALTIDVEDYFHVSAFADRIAARDWSGFESRVVQNTQRLLRLLDKHNVRATCFVLGWVAEQHPQLVRDIASAGHEIGCHSYWHRLVYDLTPDEFREDTARSRDVLEEIIGNRVTQYRAPSFSITNRSLWAFDISIRFATIATGSPVQTRIRTLSRHRPAKWSSSRVPSAESPG